MPLLSSAFFLLIAVLFFFGVAAVQCFTNAFHNICASDLTNTTTSPLDLGSAYAGWGNWSYENGGDDADMFGCSTPEKGKSWWWRECPTNYTCMVSHQGTARDSSLLGHVIYVSGWTCLDLNEPQIEPPECSVSYSHHCLCPNPHAR